MTTFTPKSHVGQHGILRELDRLLPAQWEGWGKGKNRFLKSQTRKT